MATARAGTRAVACCLCGALLAARTASASTPADLGDTAQFLAGKGAAPDSTLAEHAQTQAYADYAAQIAASWKQFEQPNLEHMRRWWADRAPATYATVLYPFSGPDIGNALVLFPDADTYLLFGLEAPGAIPDLQALDDDAISAGLTQLEASLRTMFEVNYFFTRAMAKKLGTGSFNSISGLLLFFLAMNDCEVTDARRIAIAAGLPGVEVTFHRTGGKPQTVRYFDVDVADAAKRSPDFIHYLEGQGRFVTVIKSASYLMHKDGAHEPAHFEHIRSLILDRSDFIVQDDSGIPLRAFARDTWKLRFHGAYAAPTPEFGKYLQRDLRVEMQTYSTGKLPFSYGYAYKQGESNLMTAQRE